MIILLNILQDTGKTNDLFALNVNLLIPDNVLISDNVHTNCGVNVHSILYSYNVTGVDSMFTQHCVPLG